MTNACDDPSHQFMCREYEHLPGANRIMGEAFRGQKTQFFFGVEVRFPCGNRSGAQGNVHRRQSSGTPGVPNADGRKACSISGSVTCGSARIGRIVST